jgi:hypothetical protein
MTYEVADRTAAVDVYSFLLIVYEVFVGETAFPSTLSPAALMEKVVEVARPRLPESMEGTVRDVARQGWSVDPADQGSSEDLLETLGQIPVKMAPAIDAGKVTEFVAQVGQSAEPEPVKEFPRSLMKGEGLVQEDEANAGPCGEEKENQGLAGR